MDLALEEDASEDVECSDHVPLDNHTISTNLIWYRAVVVDKANKLGFFLFLTVYDFMNEKC